jgi:branched-chain amino acid transport system ATP-binding protein
MTESAALLEVQGVSKRFGGIQAVRDVSFEVTRGETVGVIGPNGAGKSTLLELVSGAQKPDTGSIRFDGRRIDGQPMHRVSRTGVVRTFQKLRPFLGMTALENVMVSALVRHHAVDDARERALECLDFVGLDAKVDAVAGTLSTGQRKRLELARAIASDPQLYLLDEVTAGIDHRSLGELVALIARLRDEGATILLIEHNLPVLNRLCDRLIAMNLGEKIAEGAPAFVLDNPAVVEAYVGSDE